MILIIDNFDSFTYNIVNQLHFLTDEDIEVVSYDCLHQASPDKADYIIFSPGPSHPSDYPLLYDLLQEYCGRKPILGICLGHQIICSAFGSDVYRLGKVYHGVPSLLDTDPESVLFRNMCSTVAGRYHSWAVTEPEGLKVTARDSSGIVMAAESVSMKLFTVQFHPESIISADGNRILENFLKYGHEIL